MRDLVLIIRNQRKCPASAFLGCTGKRLSSRTSRSQILVILSDYLIFFVRLLVESDTLVQSHKLIRAGGDDQFENNPCLLSNLPVFLYC